MALGVPKSIFQDHFSIQIPPPKTHVDTLGTILDPVKVIFGHFIDFGHFPIEIPIEPDIFWGGPSNRVRMKTKTVLKSL